MVDVNYVLLGEREREREREALKSYNFHLSKDAVVRCGWLTSDILIIGRVIGRPIVPIAEFDSGVRNAAVGTDLVVNKKTNCESRGQLPRDLQHVLSIV